MTAKTRFRGVNHIALVTADMAETVDFYQNVLEMPLVKAVDLADGGQQFYFDCGGGRMLSFLWWPDAPPRAPGIASMHQNFAKHGIQTAHGSMNHLALNISLDRYDAVVDWLMAKGIVARAIDHGLFKSVYFRDNSNIHMEFAALTRGYDRRDLGTPPVNADGIKVDMPSGAA